MATTFKHRLNSRTYGVKRYPYGPKGAPPPEPPVINTGANPDGEFERMALPIIDVVYALVPRIDAGQSLGVGIEIRDVSIPGEKTLLDPTSIPVMTLYNPQGVLLLQDQPMVREKTGYYIFSYQTDTTFTPGLYTATFTAIHRDKTARLERVGVFVLETVGVFASFSFLRILDQQSNTWYWFINEANVLTSDPTEPLLAAKQATDITPGVIPSWIILQNPAAQIRYVLPNIAGSATVTPTQPIVGQGLSGSPTFVAQSGLSFILGLDIADQLILIQV